MQLASCRGMSASCSPDGGSSRRGGKVLVEIVVGQHPAASSGTQTSAIAAGSGMHMSLMTALAAPGSCRWSGSCQRPRLWARRNFVCDPMRELDLIGSTKLCVVAAT